MQRTFGRWECRRGWSQVTEVLNSSCRFSSILQVEGTLRGL